jgi:DNA-binding PadR family transcriptional regulator
MSNPDRRPFASSLEPEFLLLGLLSQKPDHGYGLQQRIENTFPWIWRISQSQTYNILKRLENSGDLEAKDIPGQAAPPKRLYRLSPKGRNRFKSWLGTPTPSSARAIRIEFLTKLYFALNSEDVRSRDLVRFQTQSLLKELQELKDAQAEVSSRNRLSGLSLELKTQQLETALQWLEGCREYIESVNSKINGGTS